MCSHAREKPRCDAVQNWGDDNKMIAEMWRRHQLCDFKFQSQTQKYHKHQREFSQF